MTKLEKDIIYAINNKCSTGLVKYDKGAFYSEIKGILQNFAIFKDDYLFVRMDKNCWGICKKVFKNIDYIDNYKICVTNDKISEIIYGKLKTSPMGMIIDCFYLYDRHIMKIFIENDFEFKHLIHNFVEYFEIEDDYLELIQDDKFWKTIINDRKAWDWWTNTYGDLSVEEERELVQYDWISDFKSKQRNKLIDGLLS